MARSISVAIDGPLVLTNSDNPLTVTGTGSTTSTGAVNGIGRAATTAWVIRNKGTVLSARGRGINLAGAGSLDNRGLIAGPLGPPSMVTCGSGTRRGQPSSIDAPHDTSVTRSASTAASASRKCSAGSRPPPASQRSSSEDAPGSTASLHSDADRLQPDPAAQAPDRLLMSVPETGNWRVAEITDHIYDLSRHYRSHAGGSRPLLVDGESQPAAAVDASMRDEISFTTPWEIVQQPIKDHPSHRRMQLRYDACSSESLCGEPRRSSANFGLRVPSRQTQLIWHQRKDALK